MEILPFNVTANTTINLMVVRASGVQNVDFKYIVFRGNLTINEHRADSSTIVGQGNARGAMAVGAARYTRTPAFWGSPAQMESFSSTGGTPINGVVRNKPDFTAPDGVNTSVNFNSLDLEGDNTPNFFGTSCAAPHAAAGTALLLSAKKNSITLQLLLIVCVPCYREQLLISARQGLITNPAQD